jgi:hypothetical protein
MLTAWDQRSLPLLAVFERCVEQVLPPCHCILESETWAVSVPWRGVLLPEIVPMFGMRVWWLIQELLAQHRDILLVGRHGDVDVVVDVARLMTRVKHPIPS